MSGNDEKPPHLHLCVENDAKADDREWAKQKLEFTLRDLAANIMRLVRGAGKPHEVGRQCSAVVEAYHEFRDKTGGWPTPYEVSDALGLSARTSKSQSEKSLEWEMGLHLIMCGSLQRAAALTLNQNTQLAAGERELFEGFRIVEAQREENRRASEDASKGRRKQSGKKRAQHPLDL